MNVSDILFYFLSALALGSAIMVVISKNPIYSVLWLIVTLIVYAGAIMVLFLFVIMLMNLDVDSEPQKNKWMKLAGVVSGGCLLLVIVAALKNAEVRGQAAGGQGDIGLIEHLGKALFTDYVVPFEISSILFLSAMVGAVVIGKKGD